jgi:hypothetical protein
LSTSNVPAKRAQAETALSSLAKQIQEKHYAASAAAAPYIEHGLDAGDLLIKAKGQVAHGQFGEWVERNCKMAQSTARFYMQLARNRTAIEAKISLLTGMGLRDALRIAAGKPASKTLTVSDLKPAAPAAAAKVVADALAPLKRITHLDLYEMWKRATDEVRTRFLDSVGAIELLEHVPDAWRGALKTALKKPAAKPAPVRKGDQPAISADLSIPEFLDRVH